MEISFRSVGYIFHMHFQVQELQQWVRGKIPGLSKQILCMSESEQFQLVRSTVKETEHANGVKDE